jgi:RNA polymerase sigma-70 factor (ECF subfamily)
MSLTEESSLETRKSLLSRLRDHEDRESWQTFFDLYWRLLYNVARRAGLEDVDAQDVVQDTVMSAAREIPEFRYDPERGSFKQWLFRILRRRVSDHFRKFYRQPAHAGISPETLEETGHADAIVMRDGVSLSDAWDQEWERSVLNAAIAQVRAQANPKHFQVFDYCVLKEWPASKVAATLGLNVAQVYLAKHRVAQATSRENHRLVGGDFGPEEQKVFDDHGINFNALAQANRDPIGVDNPAVR